MQSLDVLAQAATLEQECAQTQLAVELLQAKATCTPREELTATRKRIAEVDKQTKKHAAARRKNAKKLQERFRRRQLRELRPRRQSEERRSNGRGWRQTLGAEVVKAQAREERKWQRDNAKELKKVVYGAD